MQRITDEAELRQLRAEGAGFIYANGPHLLHRVSCAEVVDAAPAADLYFTASTLEAVIWLNGHEHSRWGPCHLCRP